MSETHLNPVWFVPESSEKGILAVPCNLRNNVVTEPLVTLFRTPGCTLEP